MGLALLFPGQGSQKVGMGLDFYEAYPESREVFQEADEQLRMHLSRLIFEGPEEELAKTEFTQPAMFTVCTAVWRALQREFGEAVKPLLLAGHSLGEYTALCAARVFSFAKGVELVRNRGKFMQEAVPLGEGKMAAIMGLSDEEVTSICREVEERSGRVCDAANFNAPSQVVISGHADAVDMAMSMARERGAKRVVELKVSAPFHSKLMVPVAARLKELFEEIKFSDPAVPVVANYTALPVSTAEEVKEALYHQTYSPVLWTRSVEHMAKKGVSTYLEVGPGGVLKGLVKKIDPRGKAVGVESTSDLRALEQLLSGGEAR